MPDVATRLNAVKSLRKELGSRLFFGTDLLREFGKNGAGEAFPPAGGVAGESGIAGLVAGLRPGRLTEVVVAGPSQGGGLVLAALLARARLEGSYAMLFDVGSGFAVESFPDRDLETLLWVGCDSVLQAVTAFDIAARDENFRWFVLDGREGKSEDWRAVRPSLWQRISLLLRERGAAGLILARTPVTGVSKDRHEVTARFGLEALHAERSRLFSAVRVGQGSGNHGEGGRRRLAG
ncbi:MAG: hypothetical protein KDN18_20890 [Verrucomicrobiae bacterium]|nr:hypothetical protein [Verrucomicrobiae bacterium]